MKKVLVNLWILLVIVYTVGSSAVAQTTMMGGKGLLRAQDAEPIDPGLIYISSYVLTFLETVETKGSVTKDHTLNVGFTIGLSQLFEVVVQAVPYQDDQHGPWGPPGDTKLGLKFHPPAKRVVNFGLLSYVNFPTARKHNIKFEPFSCNAFGWGLLGLATFDFRNSAAALPLKLHLNLGYRDHDANDRYFSDEKDQLLFAAGFKFPIRTMILYSEFSGEIFLNNMEHVPISQNSVRFTQGLRFIGPWHIVCDIAGDISLSEFAGEKYEYELNPYLKRYAGWKIVFGITWHTTLFQYLSKEEKLERRRQREEEAKREQIRKEREKASRDLEKIKKDLERKKNK